MAETRKCLRYELLKSVTSAAAQPYFADFYWPSALNRAHVVGGIIFVFHFDVGEADYRHGRKCARDSWRKTTYNDIQKVPFWKVLVQFSKEDEEDE